MTPWIEAMRLRTLPVSVAGVLAGTACAAYHHGFNALPMAICLAFAIIAQIASNFANEYYDFKNGLDKKGREGFRRGVTEGDISPAAMKRATYILLGLDILLGCSLIIWGGIGLIPVGAAIAVFAVGYSAGPYPLSHHGLGDIAVIIFFGLVPVLFTEYVQLGVFTPDYVSICVAFAVGIMAANVLIVNNYRDFEDDKAVGKHTTVVIFGRKTMARVYLLNGIAAAACIAIATSSAPVGVSQGWVGYLVCHLTYYSYLQNRKGSELNKLLKYTSILLLLVAVYLLILLSVYPSPAKP
ncbi:MAG: 1,4-dihydroxy-2-naphthoate octaprenyltransferase [Muribaculaceae bacterium]|nr:1,4-dihydroxy-2-naphthoate octaprenyltransferase [Muribaculaceae bacterium]